jgi:PEP-CTERM motif
MTLKNLPTLLAAALFSLTAAVPATAATVLDQDAFVPPPSGPPVNGRIVTTIGNRAPNLVNAIAGQTVTAGVAGRLDSIELQGLLATQPGTIFGFTLFDGDLSTGGRVIGAINGLTPTAGGAPSVLLSLAGFGYNVTPGQLFSFSIGIVAGAPDANARLITGNFAGAVPPAPPSIVNFNDYARGTRFFSNNGSPFIAQLNGDLGFRTFVDTAIAGVPEPESWAMMIIGFGLAGASMRRRQRAAVKAV